MRAVGAALGGPLAQQDAVAALEGDRNAFPKMAKKGSPEAFVVQQPLLIYIAINQFSCVLWARQVCTRTLLNM